MSSVRRLDDQQWSFWKGQWWRKEDDKSEWERISGDTWWLDAWGQWQRRWGEIKQSDGWTSGGTGSAGVSTTDPDGVAGVLGDEQRDGAQSRTRRQTFSLGGDESAGAGAEPSGVSHNAVRMYAAIVALAAISAQWFLRKILNYITYQHTWILYVGMAPAREMEVMFTDISGNHIAQIMVCPSATVGTFNASLDQQHLKIPKGMQYVSEGGLAHLKETPG